MTRKNDFVRLYITVDERGNLGQSRKGERYYTVVGTVVFNREAFEAISRYYTVLRGREIKYHDDPDLREDIIRQAAPFIEDVYFVMYHKDPVVHNTPNGLPKDRKVAKHIAMLQAIANKMLDDIEWGPVDVDIDYNRLVAGEPVTETFECSRSRDGREMVCRVVDSKENYGLMTNDFVVGSVGDFYTNPGNVEARKLVSILRRKPKEVHLRDENKKLRGFRHGE